jgi:hypothetical protein
LKRARLAGYLGAAMWALLGAAFLLLSVLLIGVVVLDAILHPHWPGLPSFSTVGRVTIVIVVVVAVVFIWNTLIKPMGSLWSSRQRQRREKRFWRSIENRKQEVSARLLEWERVDALAREHNLREQEDVVRKMVTRKIDRKRPESSNLTREERIEFGLELSAAEKERLRHLMPFLTTARPSSPEAPDGELQDPN